ncbi:CYTH domain-containing protein [Undibacterium oligocarboniphilum]|uniref:CYTH domain-containing protein n=1 Tax=Undibacterium oligocarboniphilum TaxID=666702 RepID=A0A850QG74_9BURK|nr:CYTH domain-containing protein [Undibacterium oligocarboniphilum]MBC3870307.1 CYTH domain-containing protein [Undibacterium oligocarboniphilum]NVO78298.1 CYTH domain-containing protein [Undibacterium oligocarboniphilum]
MGVEIERKFLVQGEQWKLGATRSLLCQGYISAEPGRIVRVRIDGDAAMLTIKGMTTGIRRAEWEYPIPVTDARSLLDELCQKPLIEKYRYRLPIDGLIWEIDEFLGDNAGLVVAEVELESESQLFDRPVWLGAEVSHDHRYANASLLKHPFSQW